MTLDGTPLRFKLCKNKSPLIIEQLGVCVHCLRTRSDQARPLVEATHAETRRLFDLPDAPPRSEKGAACPEIALRCRMSLVVSSMKIPVILVPPGKLDVIDIEIEGLACDVPFVRNSDSS